MRDLYENIRSLDKKLNDNKKKWIIKMKFV